MASGEERGADETLNEGVCHLGKYSSQKEKGGEEKTNVTTLCSVTYAICISDQTPVSQVS